MIGAKICVGADRPDPQPAAPVAEAATKRESDIAVDKEVVRQIQNLGSDFDEIADAAEASLLKLKYRAVEALEKTCKHANPDVARRAERLLAKIDEHTLTVLDATGTPIVGGKLELILHPKTFTFVPDERGRILVEKPASPKDDLHKFFIGGYNTQARFSHPEYGATGWTPIYFSKPGKQVFPVPLVKRGSEAYDRALRGVIVDPDDHPVGGAAIKCYQLRLGSSDASGMLTNLVIYTDDQGRFAYYPMYVEGRMVKALIPAASSAIINIEPAKSSNLFPYLGRHSNDGELKIQLERAHRFHKLKFEKRGGGFIDDSRELYEIYIKCTRPQSKREGVLPARFAAEGGHLLPGTYTALLHNLNFVPLEVKEDSPDELVFRRPAPMTYRGRVVSGVTGKPMAGAFVLAGGSTNENHAALLTAENWQAIHKLPEHPQLTERALAKTFQIEASLRAAARTNDTGHFELSPEPDEESHILIALEENYLPVEHSLYGVKPDSIKRISVQDFQMFPAARISIRPVTDVKGIAITTTWQFEPEGQPEWFGRFHEAATSARHYEFANWLRPNELQTIFVPGDTALRIRLSSKELVAVLAPPNPLKVSQGATEKIGEVSFIKLQRDGR